MPSLVISIDGTVIKEVALTKQRTTLGRRPYNDIVISNPAVSGEHALLHCVDGQVSVEDLQSTNGTYVNRQRVTCQPLQHGDLLHVGQYELRLQLAPRECAACLRIDGDAAREVGLTKSVTTLGKPGQAVAAVTRQTEGYTLALSFGADGSLRLNGQALGAGPQPLRHGDLIELAGTRLRFMLRQSTAGSTALDQG